MICNANILLTFLERLERILTAKEFLKESLRILLCFFYEKFLKTCKTFSQIFDQGCFKFKMK